MEFYNKYLKYLEQPYNSEIAFLSNEEFLISDLFFLDFSDEYRKKRGFYHDQSGYLKSLFWEGRKSGADMKQFFLQKTDGVIKEIQFNKQFHSYIQIIDDPQNPQLNSQYMIFKFGLKIYGKIKDRHLSDCYFNTFGLKISLVNVFSGQKFPSYDSSHFLENHQYIQPNPALPPLNSFVHFPNFNLIAIKRKEKLEKIQKSLFLP